MTIECCFRAITQEQEEDIEEVESVGVNEEAAVDDGQIKPFTCQLCAVSFSKFEGYREHFISAEHRYKRRDEKKRLGVCFLFSLLIHSTSSFPGRFNHR